LACGWTASLSAQTITLPNRKTSQKFAVIGDAGTGDKAQYAVAKTITRTHELFPFTFAIMLGDNLYGGERPQDFANKFELPYKTLLDDKVEFDATLGNHDDPNQRFYKPFNMGGERYRTFKKGNIRFFILDSNYLDPDQLKWLEKELSASGSDWKIAYFHHPLYTSASRGPELELRKILEPLFIKYGIDVVFSGHEHIYERIKPQSGIHYFTAGGAAKLRLNDTHPGDVTEIGFATDRSFMIVEVAGDSMFFQAISGAGNTVDKGVIARQGGAGPKTVAAAPSPVKRVARKTSTKKPVVRKPAPQKTTTVPKTTTTTKTPVKPVPG
ncbi:MAG TPA: metallophosphoesterase, partial [Gemmatimonadales bacterium]|nr:metallophosphoesterase [Gemmatimonadales bacterium]